MVSCNRETHQRLTERALYTSNLDTDIGTSEADDEDEELQLPKSKKGRFAANQAICSEESNLAWACPIINATIGKLYEYVETQLLLILNCYMYVYTEPQPDTPTDKTPSSEDEFQTTLQTGIYLVFI